MPWAGFGAYAAVLAVALACGAAVRLARLPAAAAAAALVVGLVLGRPGLQVVRPEALDSALPGVMLHVAVLLGVLGFRLGQGMLRLPLLEVLRRSLYPLGLATVALGAGAVLIPWLLPDAAAGRSFYRFTVPLASVLAVLPLLALRDFRGRPPADAGSLFLVATALVGAVHSFAPQLLWSKASPGIIWRGPLLVLGESGALGVAGALVWLLLVRRVRVPRGVAATVVLAVLAERSIGLKLWPPFTALGFGIILGRTGEAPWRLPRAAGGLFSEAPFALLVAATSAPDLFRESVALPATANVAVLAALLLLVRSRVPGGRALVTGPGLLFLGLTLTVRLDGAMGPIRRYAVDFALPAWIVLRLLMAWLSRSRARSSPTSTRGNAGSASPRRTRGSDPA